MSEKKGKSEEERQMEQLGHRWNKGWNLKKGEPGSKDVPGK